ncbi:MAG: hypothetical protein DRO93_14775 [Candidatus Thorarchaeota archaeon]|nr:MAG: hypothetical protein DRO93_14775 [Candidatus Thorarchaeota archaeon]
MRRRVLFGACLGVMFNLSSAAGSWHWESLGLSDKKITAMAKDVFNNSPLYAVTDSTKVYRWQDDKEWVRIDRGLPEGRISALEAVGDSLVFVGMDSGRVFRSRDMGSSWEEVLKCPLDEVKVKDFATSTAWVDVIETISQRVYPLFGIRRRVYVLFADKQGGFGEVFMSEDLGEHWYEITNSLEPPAVCIEVVSLQDVEKVFIGTMGGLYISQDFGNSWQKIKNFPKGCTRLATGIGLSQYYLAFPGYIIYATDEEDSLFVSWNGRQRWMFERISGIRLLAADKGIGFAYAYAEEQIFLGLPGELYYGSIKPPSPVSSLLGGRGMVVFEYPPIPELWIGTDNGIFKLILIPEHVESSKGNSIPLEAYLDNYPNPFNISTIIKYRISGKGRNRVKLSVYDLLGREVKVLVDGVQDEGEYSVEWDGRDERGFEVSSGVYICQLQEGSAKLVRKMVLVK